MRAQGRMGEGEGMGMGRENCGILIPVRLFIGTVPSLGSGHLPGLWGVGQGWVSPALDVT